MVRSLALESAKGVATPAVKPTDPEKEAIKEGAPKPCDGSVLRQEANWSDDTTKAINMLEPKQLRTCEERMYIMVSSIYSHLPASRCVGPQVCTSISLEHCSQSSKTARSEKNTSARVGARAGQQQNMGEGGHAQVQLRTVLRIGGHWLNQFPLFVS